MVKNVNRDSSKTHHIERHVGQRIRERRTMLGLTQQQLADLIGVTYQQAHKYERGINRVSAGRLFEIAQVLGVEINFFYEELDTSGEIMNERQRMCLDLARNFTRIKNEKHQDAISTLCRVLSEQEKTEVGVA
ncbi:helix-turn-helix transcriptional regulator [Kiloniella laminariae]|uniref:Helix-turn-helix transcriptional regulator n=1 Tax=Kiloniella laminariae TaxID=454162 RepID=A0ABT4LKJ0_9PROT|nr:helix-turn-helix transcriptional regulator [Kiloniella laminariae]MCZ4281620.1 helix-turn-helix transcriptional regulator [Kiloniella laminariae]